MVKKDAERAGKIEKGETGGLIIIWNDKDALNFEDFDKDFRIFKIKERSESCDGERTTEEFDSRMDDRKVVMVTSFQYSDD